TGEKLDGLKSNGVASAASQSAPSFESASRASGEPASAASADPASGSCSWPESPASPDELPHRFATHAFPLGQSCESAQSLARRHTARSWIVMHAALSAQSFVVLHRWWQALATHLSGSVHS